jgi:hypothetical protein
MFLVAAISVNAQDAVRLGSYTDSLWGLLDCPYNKAVFVGFTSVPTGAPALDCSRCDVKRPNGFATITRGETRTTIDINFGDLAPRRDYFVYVINEAKSAHLVSRISTDGFGNGRELLNLLTEDFPDRFMILISPDNGLRNYGPSSMASLVSKH